MTPVTALIELLDCVATGYDNAVLITSHELSQWPDKAVEALKSQKLVVRAGPATSTICTECEHECIMPVYTVHNQSGDSASFIVCDKLDDTNRIPVPPTHLTQWRCSPVTICRFIANSLELRRSKSQANHTNQWEIGIAKGDKRRQMLCLQANNSLFLVAGNKREPLAEFIGYQNEVYSVDKTMTGQLVDAANTADERYTPSTARREVGKMDTQDRDKELRKEYRKLEKKNSEKSNTWRYKQIGKLKIACTQSGKKLSPDTIRKIITE